ncbi:MAG: SurA N-terminal domain-containing protein [Pseudomonadota bacterium]
MLESLRLMMRGVTAKILIALLVVSFAVWGVSDVFIGGGGTNTIVVGETKVGLGEYRLAYQNQVNAVSQQFGQRLSREQARALGIEQSVLSQLVAGAVLDENARKMGLGVSEDNLATLIGDDPSFRDEAGNFSRQRLDFALRQVGLSEEDYINNRKNAAIREQLISAMMQGLDMPDAFFDFMQKYEAEKRVFEYVIVTGEAAGTVRQPTDSEIEEYYDTHKGSYTAPEFRKLVTLQLTAEDIAKPDDVSAEDVSDEYERIKTRFTTPEKRQIQQLTFSDANAADEAAKRLKDGEFFEAIMSELGRSADDISLGSLTKSQVPDQAIAEAAFNLDLNQTSDVVTGLFGPVILRVTAIEPESVRPLAEVEADIRQSLAVETAADELYDIHDKIEDERAAGDSLTEAARKVGLTAITFDMVDLQGNDENGNAITDLPNAPNLLREAFDTDAGVEADPVSIGTSGFAWYEVDDVIDTRQKPLTEVRADVISAWEEAELANMVDEIAVGIRDRVAKGEDFNAVIADVLPASSVGLPTEMETSPEMTRSDTDSDISANAVAAGFEIPKGDVTVAPGPSAPDKLVLRVSEVMEETGTPPADNLKTQFNGQLANSVLNDVVSQMQANEDVAIYQQAIETAITY